MKLLVTLCICLLCAVAVAGCGGATSAGPAGTPTGGAAHGPTPASSHTAPTVRVPPAHMVPTRPSLTTPTATSPMATATPRHARVASAPGHSIPAAHRPAPGSSTPVSRRAPPPTPLPRRPPAASATPRLARPTSTAIPSPTPRPTATAIPSPLPSPTPRPTSTPQGPQSWLARSPILTIYGRSFGTAPILGRLGMDNTFADLEWQFQPFAHGIKNNDGGIDPTIAIHLIYAMAVPCSPGSNCLYYLDDAGVDIVKTYIEPAAKRHWLVILDDQLGLSDPVTEVRRLIAKGYLKYDNVEVALDPEFRTAPGQDTPGIPVGSVTAAEINAAQAVVSAYSAGLHLAHRKVMLVHQFQWGMIQNRSQMKNYYPYVNLVVVADGFGAPGLKAHVYSELFGPGSPHGVKWRGIKLFYPNPYESAGHGDDPPMTWPQVMGRLPATDTDGKQYFVRPAPRVIVIA